MDFKKCSRCGNFYISNADVCPKCSTKENFELSTFKSYIEENGTQDSTYEISSKTGISVKNINRFMGYEKNINDKNNTLDTISNSKQNNNDITFLI